VLGAVLRMVLLIVAAGAVAGPAQAQDWARKMFDATRHDFGKVARASKAEHRFTIRNPYKDEIHVASLRVSCGCVTARITRDTLKSFETAEVVVDFNTRAFLGQRSATVTVVFDRPYYTEVRLEVTGYIRSDVVIDPPLVDLGVVDEGSPGERKVNVWYAGRSDWEIVDVASANQHFEVDVAQTARGNGRVDYELLVRLKPDAPAGHFKDQLILVTNDRSGGRIPLFVEGQVVPAVTVSPASLVMGQVTAGEQASKLLIVRSKTPITIGRVECDDPAFHFEHDDQPSALHRVRVIYTAPSEPGDVNSSIRIFTGAGDRPSATCDVLVTVGQAAP
jgi:hypothetical protein